MRFFERGLFMTPPAYFVVAKRHGVECVAIYHQELPRAPIRNLVYVVRLDTLPNGHDLVRASTGQLYAVYCRLRDRGKLPPRWEPPPKSQAAKAERLIGHREGFARTWDSSRPAEPYPRPEDIKPKLDAPARIIIHEVTSDDG
jgi:hypothetical protein